MNVSALTEYLLTHSNAEKAVSMEGYLKNQFKCIGLQATKRRKIFKDFLKNNEDFSLDRMYEESQKVWASPYRECHYLYIDFLIKHKKKLKEEHMKVVEELIIKKSWWDTVDMLATHLVGILFKKYPKLCDEYHVKWQQSDNIWLKRSLILFQLKYKEETDTDLLSKIIEDNLKTGEFFINKAIGWALREYSKVNPQWVLSFVENHQLSKLSKREGLKYLKKNTP